MIKNPFNHSSKLLFTLSLLWTGVLLLIGAWWVYIIVNFEDFIGHEERSRITKMLAWEGGSFILLLMLLSISLFILFMKDQKRTKSLQAFFATLTHELKTPLASVRLQSEVLREMLEGKGDTSVSNLLQRLVADTAKLETQMDKILQLSRIERGGELNLTSLSLAPFIKKLTQTWVPGHIVKITTNISDINVDVDEFALELIMKNLLENTRIHTNSKNINIHLEATKDEVLVSYCDEGEFRGELKKLGSLFYKHNSTKGSGIGLYLTQKLLEKMEGHLLITPHNNGLQFNLKLKRSEELHA